MLSDKVYIALKDDIIQGFHLPGQHLLLSDLKDRYETGTSPIREAMFKLESQGLLCAEKQKGFHVSPISCKDCSDLFSARRYLENRAIASAIQHGDDDWEANVVMQFHKLSKIAKAQNKPANVQDWELAYHAFSCQLTAACPSIYIQQILVKLRQLTRRYCLLFLNNLNSEISFIMDEIALKSLFEAVLARDAEQAKILNSRYLTGIQKRVSGLCSD